MKLRVLADAYRRPLWRDDKISGYKRLVKGSVFETENDDEAEELLSRKVGNNAVFEKVEEEKPAANRVPSKS